MNPSKSSVAGALRRAVLPSDLRQRILDASRDLLEQQGPNSLSMREVARRAGVTHQAPYHHFADRESILAELVASGFDELQARLSAAHDLAASRPAAEVLQASGEAYVGFALDHAGVFRLMFRPEVCDPGRFPVVRAAGERAQEELQRLVTILHGAGASPDLALTYWAQVHGLACLIVDGPLGLAWPGAEERQAGMRNVLSRFAGFVRSSIG